MLLHPLSPLFYCVFGLFPVPGTKGQEKSRFFIKSHTNSVLFSEMNKNRQKVIENHGLKVVKCKLEIMERA